MATLYLANWESPMDIPSALECLIDMHRSGCVDATSEIAACIRYVSETPCETTQEAMVLIAVARILYGHAIEYAALGDAGTLTLMIEADSLTDRALAFFSKETGDALATQADLRGCLH